METIDRVAALMMTIEEFSELLDEETVAIKAANAKGVASLLDRKQFLALHYVRQMTALADHKEELAKLDGKVKTMLVSTWEEFSAKKDANIRALQVAQRATRQVVNLIVDAIRQARGNHVERNYGGIYGSSAHTGQITAASCVSVAVNRML